MGIASGVSKSRGWTCGSGTGTGVITIAGGNDVNISNGVTVSSEAGDIKILAGDDLAVGGIADGEPGGDVTVG